MLLRRSLALKLNKILFVVLKLSISSALLYYVLSRTGIGQVAGTLRNISPVSFLSAVFLYIFAQFISTFRWQLFLPEGLRLKKLFSLYMIGSFFNTFLPGVIGGDAVKAYYLYKETGKADMSFASIFMDRYLGFVVLILICTIAFPFGYQYFHGSRIEWLLPFTVLSFFIASFLIFGLRLGQRVRFLSEFYNYFHTYRNRKHLISKGLMLSAVVQLSGITAVSILADGMGQHIPFLAFLIFIPLIVLFAMLPISISGLGVREGAFVLFFGLIGVKPEAATAISLAWFITISTAGIWGFIEYIRYKKEMVDI
jgi:glycosyltransferase 2 family protein